MPCIGCGRENGTHEIGCPDVALYQDEINGAVVCEHHAVPSDCWKWARLTEAEAIEWRRLIADEPGSENPCEWCRAGVPVLALRGVEG